MLSHVRAGMQKYKLKIKDVLCAPRKSAIMELLLMEAFFGVIGKWRDGESMMHINPVLCSASALITKKKTILMF